MQDDITFENPLLASAQRRRVDQMLRQDAGGVSGFGVVQRDGGTGRGFQPTDIAGMAEQVDTLARELQAQAMGSRMEDRIDNPEDYPNAYIQNEDGSRSTHLMAAEIDPRTRKSYAFPMIVQNGEAGMHKFTNPQEALQWNLKNGNVKEFNTIEEADAWSQNYKTDAFNEYHEEDQRTVQRENATETGMMGVSGEKLRTLAQTKKKKKHFDDTITELAESDHGRTPQVSNDGRDRVAGATPTYDIGYGHKIKASEHTSGKIHGITFKNQDGTFRTLTDQDIKDIYKADLKSHTDSIRAADWDEKLKDRSSSWAKLGQGYRLALSSLAYNVGNHTALSEWSAVFDAAIDNNPLTFAAELRRQDTRVKTHAELVTTLQAASPETPNIGEMSPEDLITTLTGMGRATTKKDFTAGTDNRVLREMFAAGFINSESDFDDIKEQLPEATDRYDKPNGYID